MKALHALGAAALTLMATAAMAGPTYTITELQLDFQDTPTAYTIGGAINSSGSYIKIEGDPAMLGSISLACVAGANACTRPPYMRGYSQSNSSPPSPAYTGIFTGINASNVAIGEVPFYPWVDHAFIEVLGNQQVTDIGLARRDVQEPDSWVLNSHSFAINSRGWVVGIAEMSDQQQRAFLWVNNGLPLLDLGSFGGGTSAATGINDSGVVVGSASLPDGTTHAFAYANAAMQDLRTLGGSSSWANAINASGTIVGCSHLAGDRVFIAFIAPQGGAMQAIPNPQNRPSCAVAVNTRGDVVGWALAARKTSHPLLYRNGRVIDLNQAIQASGISGWALTEAVGINDQGQIIGTGVFNGQKRGYILTPL